MAAAAAAAMVAAAVEAGDGPRLWHPAFFQIISRMPLKILDKFCLKDLQGFYGVPCIGTGTWQLTGQAPQYLCIYIYIYIYTHVSFNIILLYIT